MVVHFITLRSRHHFASHLGTGHVHFVPSIVATERYDTAELNVRKHRLPVPDARLSGVEEQRDMASRVTSGPGRGAAPDFPNLTRTGQSQVCNCWHFRPMIPFSCSQGTIEDSV